MRNRTYKFFMLQILSCSLIIVTADGINNYNRLSAGPKTGKSIIAEKKNPAAAKKKSLKKKSNPPETSAEITPLITEQNTAETKNEKIVTEKKSGSSETSVEITPAITEQNTTGVKYEKPDPGKKSETPKASIEITPVITDRNTTGVKDEKPDPDKKSETPKVSIEITPVIIDRNTPGVNENITSVKKDPVCIKTDDLFNHPEIILNAYKEAYPALITEVTKGEKDWTLKFANGNIYCWADGKILPEPVLSKSDKYTRYSIYPYNMNGRSPESYTKEMIEKLRVKKQPHQKKKSVPGIEGSLYKELLGITTKKSAKKQLVEVKLSGHYINIHRTLAEKIKSIDLKTRELAKTDPEVSSYLKNISSIQAFNWRKIAGTDRMSNHSYGIAIDILPKKYRKKILYWGWEQDKNDSWMLLPQSSLWTPPDSVVKIFREEGFIWGGHWDRYDTMHFEYRPELICLSKNVKFDQ